MFFFPSGGDVDDVLVRLSFVINKTNYQGCQFDLHCIQCESFTDILEIVNCELFPVENHDKKLKDHRNLYM